MARVNYELRLVGEDVDKCLTRVVYGLRMVAKDGIRTDG